MILVIADDFSGAAEVAGVAHQFGLTAEVQTDGLRDSACEVVVVDANTRSLSSDTAASVMKEFAPAIVRANPRWVFKKVDSVLRGAIVPELNSLAQALGLRSCLLINANPRKHRVVRSGELVVDGIPIHRTRFADDPEHPRRSSSVVALLGAESGQVRLIDNVEQMDESDASGSIAVANVESSFDLSPYAVLRKRSCLLSGGAEFFEALLAAEFGRDATQHDSNLRLQPGTLVVRGTSVRHNHERFLGNPLSQIVCANLEVEAAVSQVCRQLSENSLAVICSECDRSELQDDTRHHDPAQLHGRLIEVVVRVCRQCRPLHLWIEGGRTASGLVRASSWERLHIQHVYADGVVGLRAVDPTAPSIVVKPGSYQWPIAGS